MGPQDGGACGHQRDKLAEIEATAKLVRAEFVVTLDCRGATLQAGSNVDFGCQDDVRFNLGAIQGDGLRCVDHADLEGSGTELDGLRLDALQRDLAGDRHGARWCRNPVQAERLRTAQPHVALLGTHRVQGLRRDSLDDNVTLVLNRQRSLFELQSNPRWQDKCSLTGHLALRTRLLISG